MVALIFLKPRQLIQGRKILKKFVEGLILN